jgi:transforming growth factor-beta-induced protein
MKLNLASIFLAASAYSVVAQDQTIADLAIATEDLSSLVAAVQAADLVETLSDPAGTFTVFAPVNSAFEGVDPKYLTEPWKAHLTDILLYHVLDSEVMSTDVTDGLLITPLNGGNFTATVNDTGVFLGSDLFSSQVTTADVAASNGYIHVVSALFLPPWLITNLADIAANVEGFGSVATFITQAGLESEIAAENRTIFAPNADAFAAISPDLTAQIVNDESLIGVVLKHHIVEGVWSKAALTDGLELTTLDGNPLVISVSGDSVMVDESAVVGKCRRSFNPNIFWDPLVRRT